MCQPAEACIFRVEATQSDRGAHRRECPRFQDRLGVLLAMGRGRRPGEREHYPRSNGHHHFLRESHELLVGHINDSPCQSGLYAAFLSAFLIHMLGRLEEDPSKTIRDVLIHQTMMIRNTSLGPYEPQPFEPSPSIVAVNILLFVGLEMVLIAAFLSMLIKSWIRELDHGLKSIPTMKDRATVREYRAQGFERYKLPQIVAFLPLLIYASLSSFSCGLVILLLSIYPPIAFAIAVTIGAGALLYISTLSLSIWDASAPFRCPISFVGSLILRRMWPSMDRWYIPWIYFSTQLRLPRRILALVARVLLWKPHTDHDLVNFDHSCRLTLGRYHIARLSTEMATSVLDTVHNLLPSTASRLSGVHQSLVTAGGDPTHRAIVDLPTTRLQSFNDCALSLDQARAIATLIAHQRKERNEDSLHSPKVEQLVIPLLKSSSNRWDNILAILVSMCTAGRDDAGDLADLTISALEYERFTLSQISMIFNSISIDSLPPSREESGIFTAAGLLAAARIGIAILRYHQLSIVELAFIFAYFEALALPKVPRLAGGESRDGHIFSPYLHDDAALVDMILRLDSFPSFMRELSEWRNLSNACGAFAIHFLIRLGQASPVVYWRIIGKLSNQEVRKQEVREWAKEVTEEHTQAAARIILHSQGIVDAGLSITHKGLSDMEIQRYDQSLGPVIGDVDGPLLHAIFQEAESRRPDDMSYQVIRSFPALTNIWLAMHAQTADRRLQLPIPLQHIQWIDHPISDMVALRRLSIYSGGKGNSKTLPEAAFIKLVLHSTTFDVLLPTLQCDLDWFGRLSVDRHASISHPNERSQLLTNALNVLFRADSTPSQLSSFWMVVYRLFITEQERWEQLPDIWRRTFLSRFFSTHVTDGDSAGYLGIKWLEAVWEKVLKPRIREVVIEPVQFPWAGVEGGDWENVERDIPEAPLVRGTREKERLERARERALDQSMTKVLDILAGLQEEAKSYGLVPADAVLFSSLFDDDWLKQN